MGWGRGYLTGWRLKSTGARGGGGVAEGGAGWMVGDPCVNLYVLVLPPARREARPGECTLCVPLGMCV